MFDKVKAYNEKEFKRTQMVHVNAFMVSCASVTILVFFYASVLSITMKFDKFYKVKKQQSIFYIDKKLTCNGIKRPIYK